MSLCSHKQRSKSPDSIGEKENFLVHRANSFSSKDRKLERKLAEKESLEACLWLSAAGFPQYVQMFEEGRFPMDFKLSDLKRDHGFLDTSSLNSLIKRLEVLNDCSVHNINTNKSFNLSAGVSPLSKLWQFREDSNRWSRRDSLPRNTSVLTPQRPVPKSNVKAGSMDFLSQIGSNDGLNNFTPLQKPCSPRPTSPYPYSSNKSISTSSLSTVAYTDSIVLPQSMVKTRNNHPTPRGSGERRPRTLPSNTLSLLSPSLSLSCQSDSSLNNSSRSNKFNQSNCSQLLDAEVSVCGVAQSADTSYHSCFDTFQVSSSTSDKFPHNNIRSDFPINGNEVMECTHSSGSSFELPDFDPTFNAREHVTMATERISSLPGSQTVMRPLPVSSRVRAYRWDVSVTKEPATNLHIYELTVNQIVLLKKLSLLKLTNLIETHSSATKARLILSQLVSDNKPYRQQQTRANQIFGVSLNKVLEQTGQCLPQVILSAMKFIIEEANDSVGIFRKCAGKSKLDALKTQCESNNNRIDFSTVAPYETASLIKHYFRQLSEPLFTFKLSQILFHIFSSFPSSHRLEAVQCVIPILPDCNRESLHTLIHFLQGIAMSHRINKMDAYNLAVCFAPTLLALSPQEWSPEKRPRGRCGAYFSASYDLMSTKEVIQSKAATESLTFLINNCDVIFTVPTDLWRRCESAETMYSPTPDRSLSQDNLSPSENVSFSSRLHSEYKSVISNKVQLMLMDSSSKRSGWKLHKTVDGVEVSNRATHDSLVPLWRATTSINTSQESLLKRILEERNMWDEDIARWQVVPLDHQTEVFRYATHSMYGPHPPREYCVIRSWHLDTLSGSVVIHSMSIKEKRTQNWPELPSVQGDLLNETFIIQKVSPVECRLVLFSQNDTRGRSPEFYSHYGAYISRSVLLLKNSFTRRGHRNCIETQV